MRKAYTTILSAVACVGFAVALSSAAQAQTRTLNMQSSWPASLTLQDNFTYFAERVEKLSGGTLKIDAMPAGQVVPAFEVLDAAHKKVIDGATPGPATGPARTRPRSCSPASPAALRHGHDRLPWAGCYHGGGHELYQEFYRDQLKLNVMVFPILPSGPQAFGWFKRPIKKLADIKGMKCRQTGIAGEVWQRSASHRQHAGRRNHSVGAARRDRLRRVGRRHRGPAARLPQVWKYHYTPGMHEAVTIGEVSSTRLGSRFSRRSRSGSSRRPTRPS